MTTSFIIVFTSAQCVVLLWLPAITRLMSLLPVSHLSLQATWEQWGLWGLGSHKWWGVEIIQNTQRSSHLSFPFEKKLLQSCRDKTEIRETEAAPETLLSKHSSRQGREETEETRKTLARFLYWFNATSKPTSPSAQPSLAWKLFLFVLNYLDGKKELNIKKDSPAGLDVVLSCC